MQLIDHLKTAVRALEPTHPVARRMLKDALKGDWTTGSHRQKQEELVRLHKAQQKINEAIALLEGLGERELAPPSAKPYTNWDNVAPGELRQAAAILICRYYGLSGLCLKEGTWYAFPANSTTPMRLGQHLWLELCRTQPLEWVKDKMQGIENELNHRSA